MAALEDPKPERRSLVEVSCLRAASHKTIQCKFGASLRAMQMTPSQVQRESQVWFTMLDLDYKSAIPVKWKDLKGGAQGRGGGG